MDRRFGCRDSWVYIDFAADSESVSLAVGYAEEADTAAVVDAMLTDSLLVNFLTLCKTCVILKFTVFQCGGNRADDVGQRFAFRTFKGLLGVEKLYNVCISIIV